MTDHECPCPINPGQEMIWVCPECNLRWQSYLVSGVRFFSMTYQSAVDGLPEDTYGWFCVSDVEDGTD